MKGPYPGTIYTRNEAADIIAKFEDILDHYGIKVPSPDDEGRGSEDGALYGSVFWDLLDSVEGDLIDLLERSKAGAEYRPYEFDTEALKENGDFGDAEDITYEDFAHATWNDQDADLLIEALDDYDMAKVASQLDDMYDDLGGPNE